MKSVSALILVCAFAVASAQYGVKGGASGSSGPVRSFFPRFSAGSIQEKKEQLQLANVDEVVGGPSVVSLGGNSGFSSGSSGFSSGSSGSGFSSGSSGSGFSSGSSGSGFGSGNTGFVKPVDVVSVGQVTNTFVEPQPQVVKSVSPVSYFTSVGPSSGSVERQTQYIQSFGPQSASGFEYLAPLAPAVQTFQQNFVPAVQSVQSSFGPALSSFQSSFAPLNKAFHSGAHLFENRAPALVKFGAPQPSNFAQNIVHFAGVQQPQPQPQVTVQPVSTFSTKGFGSRTYLPNVVSKQVVKQVAPTFVSQPAPTFVSQPAPTFVSRPTQTFISQPAPTLIAQPAPTFVSQPAPFPSSGVSSVSGKIYTDNKLSSGLGPISVQGVQQPTVVSQEKQFVDTVQTTEW